MPPDAFVLFSVFLLCNRFSYSFQIVFQGLRLAWLPGGGVGWGGLTGLIGVIGQMGLIADEPDETNRPYRADG